VETITVLYSGNLEEMSWKTGTEVRITFAFYREVKCKCLNKHLALDMVQY
jgi:hypothetical protein